MTNKLKIYNIIIEKYISNYFIGGKPYNPMTNCPITVFGTYNRQLTIFNYLTQEWLYKL